MTNNHGLLIQIRSQAPEQDPTVVTGQLVECVESYKYLGTVVHSKLSFNKNCEAVCKKRHQRLLYIWKWSRFNLYKNNADTFLNKLLCSHYSPSPWCTGLLTCHCRTKTPWIKCAGRLLDGPQLTMSALYDTQLQGKPAHIPCMVSPSSSVLPVGPHGLQIALHLQQLRGLMVSILSTLQPSLDPWRY